MATLAKLVVRLEAESSRLQTQLDKSNKRLKRWESSASKSVDRVKKKFIGLAAAYVGFQAVKNAINIHKEFTSAISDLSAITGAAGKDLEFLRQKSKEFGATTTLSASQAAEAFKLVASAKPDLLGNAEALAAVTKEAIILAEASGSTLPDAAKTLGSALNQFGLGAEDASRFINVLAAGSKFGASEIANTAEALKDSGLVAATTGTSFEELNAAIQTMSTVSLKGAEAGVGLRNVFLNLAIQNNDLFKPSVVGLTGAISNLKKAQLDDVQLLEIFGKKNIIAAKALIKQSDVLEGMTAKLTDTTTAYDQAAIKVDNLEGDTKKMNSAWEGSTILLGEKLDPAIRGVVQAMTWLAKVASSVILAVDDMGNAIGAYAAATAAALSFDFSSMSVILEARAKEREENEKSLAAIWGKVEATKALVETENSKAEKRKPEPSVSLAEQLALEEEFFEAHNERVYELQEKAEKKRAAMVRAQRQAELNLTVDIFQNLSSLMSSENKKQFEIGKKAAIAGALVKGYQAVVNSYEKGTEIGGPYVGAAFAATAAIATKMQIDAIRRQQFQSGGGASIPAINGGSPTEQYEPTSTPETFDAAGPENTGGTTYINIDGAFLSDEGIDSLIDQIREAGDRRDTIIVSRDSRNGQELAA